MSISNDTGTTQRFRLGGGAGTVSVKSATGIAQTRDGADTTFADTYVGNIRANDPVVGPDDGGALIANGTVRHGTGVQSYGVGTGAVVGNARGVGASDFQVSRTAATQVASGVTSLAAGRNNTANATRAFAAGLGSSATKASNVAFGKSCSATGSISMAVGSSSTSANQVAVAMGISCSGAGRGGFAAGDTATTAGSSAALGSNVAVTGANIVGCLASGRQATATHIGEWAYSGGRIAVNADSQSVWVTWGIRTTDNVATNLTQGLGSGSSMLLANLSSYAFRGLATAHIEGGTASKVWTVEGMVRAAGGAAIFVTGVAPVAAVIAVDGALAAATLVMTISGLQFIPVATGILATNIRWTMSGRCTRIL